MAATATGGTTNTETLIKRAHGLLADSGVTMSPSRVSRLVREYKRRVESNGFPFEAFLANSALLTADQRRRAAMNPDIAKVVRYPDPTGEEAVNNVMRGGRTQ